METMRVRLTFTDEILGTASARPDVHEKFIASKAPDAATREQEVAAVGVEQAIKDAMTVFPKNEDGEPIFWPYQILGMFKSAQQAINQSVDKSNRKESKQYMASYKSKLDLGVFIKATDSEWGDRSMIVIHMPEGTEMSNCERPLRCETMQGPRVSLANSETCPIGSWIEFDIRTMTADLMERVRSYLDFGLYNGLGQWRNSGKGRYRWTEITE